MALIEAKRKGMVPFCLTVDRYGHDYLKTMCADIGYEVVPDIESLPSPDHDAVPAADGGGGWHRVLGPMDCSAAKVRTTATTRHWRQPDRPAAERRLERHRLELAWLRLERRSAPMESKASRSPGGRQSAVVRPRIRDRNDGIHVSGVRILIAQCLARDLMSASNRCSRLGRSRCKSRLQAKAGGTRHARLHRRLNFSAMRRIRR